MQAEFWLFYCQIRAYFGSFPDHGALGSYSGPEACFEGVGGCMAPAPADKRRAAYWFGLALVTMMLRSGSCGGEGGRLCRRPERPRGPTC